MFSKLNNIGNTLKKISRGTAVLGAAIAGTTLGMTGQAMGALADVQSIVTSPISGSTTLVNNVPGAGGNSGFTSAHNYNLDYLGEDLAITKINTTTTSYVPSELASAVVDRSVGPDTDTVWYAASGTNSNTSSTLKFMAAPEMTAASAFAANNILVGADNLFTNNGNAQSNNTNIERMDMLFPAGITTSSSNVFAIFERGLTNQHDAFKIAAITGLDASGNPSHYGQLISVRAGTYGKKDVVANQNYIVTRRSDATASDPQHPSDMVNQPIGGVVIPTDTLANGDGLTIYGYSLFAADVNGSGDALVNWQNTSVYASGTTEVSGGGIDLVGTTAVLFTAAPTQIPEPATGTLLMVGVVGFLGRRSKRRRD